MEPHQKGLWEKPPKTASIKENDEPVIGDYSKSYCIGVILKEDYLWDMRCWHERSKDEVLRWLDLDLQVASKNCGHCVLCVRKLIEMKVPKEEIADYIMQNNKIQYKDAEYIGESIFDRVGTPPEDVFTTNVDPDYDEKLKEVKDG